MVLRRLIAICNDEQAKLHWAIDNVSDYFSVSSCPLAK
jgi:hypothetical protein